MENDTPKKIMKDFSYLTKLITCLQDKYAMWNDFSDKIDNMFLGLEED